MRFQSTSLSAGSVIHAVSDEQDMRKMGLKPLVPFIFNDGNWFTSVDGFPF
jgi:hypothetical protein